MRRMKKSVCTRVVGVLSPSLSTSNLPHFPPPSSSRSASFPITVAGVLCRASNAAGGRPFFSQRRRHSVLFFLPFSSSIAFLFCSGLSSPPLHVLITCSRCSCSPSAPRLPLVPPPLLPLTPATPHLLRPQRRHCPASYSVLLQLPLLYFAKHHRCATITTMAVFFTSGLLCPRTARPRLCKTSPLLPVNGNTNTRG
ncbi:hypothetical protein PIB30_061509 [Stylosanthes scabra]|uniref:Transmembrane protein n=1 Tax=Stylosanthes scabra TaxID=79078 RepID=A0ABU6UN00_9FABA|nr:hypothetical protein [Stylosanthes scabra]